MKYYLTVAAWLLMFAQGIATAGVTAEILAQGATGWDGGAITYPKNNPEMTVQKISITTDGQEVVLPIHCHTIPLAAYVLTGSVKVIKTSGEEKLFKAGDAFIEVMKSWHKGIFTEDTELLVFYAGEKGVPLSVKQDADGELSKLCH